MKMDHRLWTGIVIGVLVALKYHAILIGYFPIIVVAGLVLFLDLVRR